MPPSASTPGSRSCIASPLIQLGGSPDRRIDAVSRSRRSRWTRHLDKRSP
jgi:hypothetical protein